ncbi:hypothetical protein [Halococcus thailandensis]|uniref:Uncharacterized protein n=1 Tax=Halococcus thailandensis JCM 13552 TaxID=1227457 RepID=M0NDN7_9EURY|nr:hypothetical protein [Halococcus thailandensis]EMA56077.1 hypothetical protein C451_04281 [Halococcus thailandensis JCM 13552]
MSERNIPYVYEIEYDLDECRQSVDIIWNTERTVPCLTHETVSGVHIYRSDERPTSTRRVVFEFETLNDRTRFLNSDIHEALVNALRWMSDECNTSRWERGGITLGESWTAGSPVSATDGRSDLTHDDRSVTNGHDTEGPNGR